MKGAWQTWCWNVKGQLDDLRSDLRGKQTDLLKDLKLVMTWSCDLKDDDLGPNTLYSGLAEDIRLLIECVRMDIIRDTCAYY